MNTEAAADRVVETTAAAVDPVVDSTAADRVVDTTAAPDQLVRTTAAPEFRRDLAAAVVIALIALAFFAPVLFGPYHLPAGGGDLASFLFPMYRFIAQSLSAGDLPLWNPHQYAGAPLAADNQSGLLYPPHLLLFLAWPRFPYAALEWSVALHVWWAGLGTYALLRSWRGAAIGGRPSQAGDEATVVGRPEVAAPIARSAAVLGAVAWMLSDGFVTHIGNLNYNAVAAWLPWSLLGLHRAIEVGRAGRSGGADRAHGPNRPRFWIVDRETIRWSIVGGAALGIGALAGHAQVTFFTLGVLCLYAVWRIVADRSFRPVTAFALVSAVGGGISAPMLVPALALRPHTVRAAYDYATTLEYSLPADLWLGWLPSLFAPSLYGRGPAEFWGAWDRVEVGYLGVLPWLLAGVALSRRLGLRLWRENETGLGRDREHGLGCGPSRPPSPRVQPRSGGVGFFAILALLAFLLALGSATPLHQWLLGPLELPFRAPARFVLVADLGVAALAAIGLDRLLAGLSARPRNGSNAIATSTVPTGRSARNGLWPGVIAATFGLAGIVALTLSTAIAVPDMGRGGGCIGCSADEAAMHTALWADRGTSMWRAGVTLLALAGASIALVWLRMLGRLPARPFAGLAVLLVAFDLILLGAGSEVQADDPADGYRREIAAAWLHEHAGIARIDAAAGPWQPAAAQVHGLYDIGGVYNPLRLGLYGYTLDGLERRGSAVYNLLGARYVVAAHGSPPSDSDFIKSAFTGDPAVEIWENERALPRVLLPFEVREVADDAAAFEALRAPDFDPRRTIVLVGSKVPVGSDVPVGSAVGSEDTPIGGPGGRDDLGEVGTSAIAEYGSDELAIEVELTAPAWVMLTDIYAPGWTATIDGEAADIIRANFAFRAVRVSAGSHRVEMRYTPPGWREGWLIVFAVVVGVGLVWRAAGSGLPEGQVRWSEPE